MITHATDTKNLKFYTDVINGLKAVPKRLSSKYFYDANGDKIFQELMNCEEYYPTKCELEIFSEKTAELAQALSGDGSPFDLIELGAGDAMKSTYLLRYLLEQQIDFSYMPIDISENVINYLSNSLPNTLPGVKITGLNGEYFDMLRKAGQLSDRRKVVMFLGSNVGNMPVKEAIGFIEELNGYLSKGDMLLIGIDLKKAPKTILAAYNDKQGITKRFNLNLLERINRELGGDFSLPHFDHYATYDPETGACKSYLVSTAAQTVHIGSETIRFEKDEYIFMEISQKFTIAQTEQMALLGNFTPVCELFDSKKWFMDAVWVA